MSSCFVKSYNFISLGILILLGFHVQSWSAAGWDVFPFRGGLCFHTGCVIGSKNNLGVSKNSGIPKWMVYNGKPLSKMDDLGVPLFLETRIYQTWSQKHNKLLPLLLTHTHIGHRKFLHLWYEWRVQVEIVELFLGCWTIPNDQVKCLTLGTSSSSSSSFVITQLPVTWRSSVWSMWNPFTWCEATSLHANPTSGKHVTWHPTKRAILDVYSTSNTGLQANNKKRVDRKTCKSALGSWKRTPKHNHCI